MSYSDKEAVKSFGFDLVNFSDLGDALTDLIRTAASDLTELQTTDESETETSDETDDDENYPLESTDSSRTLAGVISSIDYESERAA